MKRIILSSFFLLFSFFFGSAQPTFNKRMHFDFPSAILTSIVATDSCYFATGVISDSLPPYATGHIFVKFNLEGETELVKTLIDTTKTYGTWQPTLTKTIDGNLAVSGYVIDTLMKAMLIKYNPEGDPLFIKEHTNFLQSDLFFRTDDLKPTLDSGFVLLVLVRSPEGLNNSEIGVIKVDNLGNLVWQKKYGTIQWNEKPYSILDLLRD